jgi:cytochrome c peroxidase
LKIPISIFSAFLSLLFAGCFAGGDLAHIPYNPLPADVAETPPWFVQMDIPAGNPLTEQGVALGRMLFYDPILSSDSTMSCASCHRLDMAMADGKAFSVGVRGKEGIRSALSLANVGHYYNGLFWDGRAVTLEEQALIPVEDTLELAGDWGLVEQRLREHPRYPALFREAFGIGDRREIDRTLAAKALAQFQRTLVSYDAKFDRVKRGEVQFTEQEKRGFLIFFDASSELPFSECSHCHMDPLFTNLDFANNGIEAVDGLEAFPDPGRGGVSGRKFDNGMFRVPTLRNIELTAPYMHDGRFATLDEVIDHYISGGHFAENINPNVRRLKLSKDHKADLIAFLKTLTDTTFIHNPAFADPFKKNIKNPS